MLFALNGVAIIVEGAIGRALMAHRRRTATRTKLDNSDASKGTEMVQPPHSQGPVSAGPHRQFAEDAQLEWWYDMSIGVVWTLAVLLITDEAFVEGWIRSGMIDELTLRLS